MARRKYYRAIGCAHEGCNEVSRREYDTQRDYADGQKSVGKWKCVYHTDIDAVMSPTNTYREVELKCVPISHYDFPPNYYWQYKKDWGTEKVDSGFLYGTGYKMNASHFPDGTIIRVTIQVVLPDSPLQGDGKGEKT